MLISTYVFSVLMLGVFYVDGSIFFFANIVVVR